MSGRWSSFEEPTLFSSTRLSNDQEGTRSRISAYASSSVNTRRGGLTMSGSRILPPSKSSTIGGRISEGGGSRRRRSQGEVRQRGMCVGQQSPVKLFDHAVRSELLRRKMGCQMDTEEERVAILESLATLTRSAQGTSQATSLSGDGQAKTAKEELAEAVDRLRKAEASVAFGGAMRAAKEAVLNAPRGLEEEAAAAGARGFGRTTKVTSIDQVHGLLAHGGKPIEVVGFVGVTKPRNAH